MNKSSVISNDKLEETQADTIEGSSHQIVERRLNGKVVPTDPSQPLTVMAKQKIRVGKEALYEKWVKEITELQKNNFRGYLGSEVVRPTCCESQEYVAIFRYDNYDHLLAWMDSEERLAMLDRTCEFTQEPMVTSYHSLEFWFVSGTSEDGRGQQPQQQGGTPSREKMTIVTFLVIWLQVHYIPPNIARIPNLPSLAGEALGTFIIVALTTYLMMPLVTKYVLHWWLFPDPNKRWYIFPKPNRQDTTESIASGETKSQEEDDGENTSRTEQRESLFLDGEDAV